MRAHWFLGAALATCNTGCARLYPAVVVKVAGDDDPRGDASLSKAATRSRDVPSNVRVIRGKIPEGLDLDDDKLTVLPGYEEQYEVLGTVEGDYERRRGEALLRNAYWTWNYEETWRDALCWPQAPLKALTLGIWSVFIPLAYPCVKTSGNEEVRRINLNEALKKGSAEMGGNMVLVTGEGELLTISLSEHSISHSTTPARTLYGFVLKDHHAK